VSEGRRLLLARRLVTCDPERTSSGPLGVIEDGYLSIVAGRIAGVGARAELPERALEGATVHEAELVTPGLVDAHTHAPWAGSRHEEYALRMAGADYETIAKAGGGIVSTMRAVRAATQEQLTSALTSRLARMASLGVTTVEAKSGYGLDLASERKQLVAIRDASTRRGAPRVVPTYLALHALPPEAGGDRGAYAARVAAHDFEALASEGLFRFVDAYVERSAFSVEQVRPLVEKATARGFGVRLHVGQFADVGGAQLAAAVGACSVDHLEHVGPDGVRALAAAGVRAVLLPVASFTLAQPPLERSSGSASTWTTPWPSTARRRWTASPSRRRSRSWSTAGTPPCSGRPASTPLRHPGLLIDKKHGHVLKMDRYKYVGRAYHGMRELDREERHELYQPARCA
jgi:imidazolonepropionase